MRNFKKIMSVMVLAMLVVGLAGCGTKSPTSAVEQYFDEVKKGDAGNSNTLLNSALEEVSDEQAPKVERVLTEEVTNSLSDIMKKIEYKVNEEKVDGDTATVNVTVTGGNISNSMIKTFKTVMGKLFESAFSGVELTEEESAKVMVDALLENFKNIEFDERSADVTLVKVENEWKVEESESLRLLVMGKGTETIN